MKTNVWGRLRVSCYHFMTTFRSKVVFSFQILSMKCQRETRHQFKSTIFTFEFNNAVAERLWQQSKGFHMNMISRKFWSNLKRYGEIFDCIWLFHFICGLYHLEEIIFWSGFLYPQKNPNQTAKYALFTNMQQGF